MHLATLINTENEAEIVEFNVVPQEGAGRSVDATNNPVERIEGAKTSVTDHISVNPKQINIDASLSNYDQILESYQTDEDVQDIATEKLQTLERWQKDGTILRYEGHNRRIENDVIIIDIKDTFSATAGDSIGLKITLQQIRIAQARTQELNAPAPVRKVQKLGKQDPKEKEIPAETEVESKETKKSWLDNILGL